MTRTLARALRAQPGAARQRAQTAQQKTKRRGGWAHVELWGRQSAALHQPHPTNSVKLLAALSTIKSTGGRWAYVQLWGRASAALRPHPL